MPYKSIEELSDPKSIKQEQHRPDLEKSTKAHDMKLKRRISNLQTCNYWNRMPMIEKYL